MASVYYYHKDPITLINVLNSKLRNVDRWIKANELAVNISKTSYVIFKSRNKKFHAPYIRCKPNNSKVKFLGIYIDANLIHGKLT